MTPSQIKRILSGTKMREGDPPIPLDASVLHSWSTACERNNRTPMTVVGFSALENLAATDWFTGCLDVRNKKDNTLGTIFGMTVIPFSAKQAKEHGLDVNTLYVVSHNFKAAVSTRIP